MLKNYRTKTEKLKQPDDLKKSDNQQVGYLECIVI